jgi:hypothetical protein
LNLCKIQHLGTKMGKIESLRDDFLLLILTLNTTQYFLVDRTVSDVSEERTAFTFRIDEDGGSMFYPNVGNYLLDCFTSHSIRR